ncbi:WAS/WASL-interacting protein family member 2-like isoform X2 [Zophobas morio]|uniref:WAS/WASL-interacting protein family member 2-like isoform X2 n=1 Tax=Zophobas morio TaxID=2755281 RepID=UPI0030831D33
MPPAPPPPPPPPPVSLPPTTQKSPSKPDASRANLLSSIQQGTKLKKTVTVDKSAPSIEKSTSAGADSKSGKDSGVGSSGQKLGGLFAGGMPTLRKTGTSSSAKTGPSTAASSKTTISKPPFKPSSVDKQTDTNSQVPRPPGNIPLRPPFANREVPRKPSVDRPPLHPTPKGEPSAPPPKPPITPKIFTGATSSIPSRETPFSPHKADADRPAPKPPVDIPSRPPLANREVPRKPSVDRPPLHPTPQGGPSAPPSITPKPFTGAAPSIPSREHDRLAPKPPINISSRPPFANREAPRKPSVDRPPPRTIPQGESQLWPPKPPVTMKPPTGGAPPIPSRTTPQQTSTPPQAGTPEPPSRAPPPRPSLPPGPYKPPSRPSINRPEEQDAENYRPMGVDRSPPVVSTGSNFSQPPLNPPRVPPRVSSSKFATLAPTKPQRSPTMLEMATSAASNTGQKPEVPNRSFIPRSSSTRRQAPASPFVEAAANTRKSITTGLNPQSTEKWTFMSTTSLPPPPPFVLGPKDYASGSKVGNCVNMKFSSGTMGRTRGIKAAAPPPPARRS